jgi:hypothetical protein
MFSKVTHINNREHGEDKFCVNGYKLLYTKALLKFMSLNTQAQQRGAVIQGRSLLPIPATVYCLFVSMWLK